ncbi:hypothetical protein BU16DRAFT_172572 [Lophium mytilinum]|uniref:GPI anchored protein n=1 Tax=Lophium mytilinum TaxID=390894 RepID=A0A6A6QAJ8_9PEZI|nr:hypothetical protein BU16DRAFT_172572 [Lophium mytilinum]
MRSTTVTIMATALSLTTSTLAQSTSVTALFIPQGGDTQALDASIVGVHAATTTWAINCPVGTDSSDCGYEGAFTFTVGPSFYEAQTTEAPVFSYSVHCDLDGTSTATCTESAGGESANFPGMSTETYTGTDVGGIQTVTITGGLEKLAGATGAASASETGASASATGVSTPNTRPAAATTGLPSQSASLTLLTGTKTTVHRTEAGEVTTGTAAQATSTGAADGRAAMGMSAAGIVGVALAAFAL